MLMFDRFGYNELYDVYSSRYYAQKAASCCSSPTVIRTEYHEGEKTYAVWDRRSWNAQKFFEGESS